MSGAPDDLLSGHTESPRLHASSQRLAASNRMAAAAAGPTLQLQRPFSPSSKQCRADRIAVASMTTTRTGRSLRRPSVSDILRWAHPPERVAKLSRLRDETPTVVASSYRSVPPLRASNITAGKGRICTRKHRQGNGASAVLANELTLTPPCIASSSCFNGCFSRPHGTTLRCFTRNITPYPSTIYHHHSNGIGLPLTCPLVVIFPLLILQRLGFLPPKTKKKQRISFFGDLLGKTMTIELRSSYGNMKSGLENYFSSFFGVEMISSYRNYLVTSWIWHQRLYSYKGSFCFCGGSKETPKSGSIAFSALTT